MNIIDKRRLLLTQLNEYILALEKASNALSHSYNKCSAIGKRKQYTMEEQESFEALTSRFARTSDILTQKVSKTLFVLLQENIKTIIDAATFLEKLGIIANADDLLNVREIRNQIAHDYITEDIGVLFLDVLHYVPELQKIIHNFNAYIRKAFPQVLPS